MRAATILVLTFAILLSGSVVTKAQAIAQSEQASVSKVKESASPEMVEFDRLRVEGNDALYNTDYKTAREAYTRMTKVAPDHPAGYVYLANNLWLETLFLSRRLSTTLYSGGSFYEQSGKEDKVDPKRDKEFNDLIKQVMRLTDERIRKNSKDAEAIYYQAAALGLRAGYETTVRRSFNIAIGDANDSIKLQKEVVKIDPSYTDAYMSIGLYEYVIDSLPFLWRVLARAAGLKGSKKKGIEHLEMVTQQGQYTADDARVLLIGIYTRENKPDRALEIISFLANKYPQNYLFGVERANMLYRMNRAEEGNRVFADLLKESRISETALDIVYSQWGDALLAKSDYQAALDRYSEVKKWPKSEAGLKTLAHLQSAKALDGLGKQAEAVAEYEKVLTLANAYDSHEQAKKYLESKQKEAKKQKPASSKQ